MAKEKINATTKREDWIDLTRLIAMLIVMMNHCGLVFKGVNFWGGMFYVPVFFVLSGFLWKRERPPVREELSHRAGRLLVPYFTVNIILVGIFLVRDVIKGDYSETFLRTFGFLYGRNQLYSDAGTLFARDMFVLPNNAGRDTFFMTALNAPTWFLPALFLTVFTIEFLYVVSLYRLRDSGEPESNREKFAMHRVIIAVAIMMLAGLTWHYLTPLLLPWSIDAISFFAVFFLLGHLLGQWGGWKWMMSHQWMFALGLVLLIPGGIINGSANFSVGMYGKSLMLAYLNAASSSLIIMYICFRMRKHIPKILVYAGSKTLPLLCWHYPVLVCMERIRERFAGFTLEGSDLDFVRILEIVLTIVLICLADETLCIIKKMIREKKAEKENGRK